MKKSGEFSLIKKENLLFMITVLVTILVLLITLTIFPMDFGTYYAWSVFLLPLGLYMLLIILSQMLKRYKKINTYLSFFRFAVPSMTLKDELTGLFNQRFFHYKLKRLIDRADGRYKVGLIFIELDKYSKFIESWGFYAGNIILKNISKLLLSVIGKNDLAVHYEVEKFAVITRTESLAEVIVKAEKLRKKLHLDLLRGMEDDWKLPAAVGVSIFPDHAVNCSSLLQKADDALQRAVITRGSRLQVYYSIFERVSGKMNREFIDYLETMMASIRERDRFLYGHSERVFLYAQLICKRLRLPPEKALIIECAALLHEIGKMEINREIFEKKGLLQHRELEKYKQCPVSSAQLFMRVKQMCRSIPSMHHHERYDDSGPSVIKGSAIPLGARIIAAADLFDSITAPRPYGKGKAFKEAIYYLQQNKTTYLDPMVVDAFVDSLSDYEDISHIIEWPRDLSRIVPSGSKQHNYTLGGHYAHYYSGELHFLIKAVQCIAAGAANNEKCIYMLDKRKEEYLLQQAENFIYDGKVSKINTKPGVLERVSFPDSLLKMKKHKANIEFETKKIIKTWLDNAEKEQFDSIRLIIDHSFLKIREEKLSSWERMLTRCIKNLDVVIVCYYDFEAMFYQSDIIDDLHNSPLVIPTDLVKGGKK